jgi:AraC-like DNA-binding protein
LATLFARLDRWPALQGNAATIARLGCDEALAAVLAGLLARDRGRAAAPPLQRVRARLGDAAQPTPTLDELAALAGCSRFQVLRHFRAAYGLTPHAWLLVQRADAARRAIAAGAPLAQAAADAGFADQSHMTRVFRRHYGVTPGAWAAALQ